MIIGVMVVTLHIPESRSLKDKRKVVRRIKDHVKHRYNVSISETDGQNTWQHCELAIAMVAMQHSAIERDLQRILHRVESDPSIAMADYWIDYC